MAKKAKKAGPRRRMKTSARDLWPRRSARGGTGAVGPVAAPRSKWELSELDGVSA